MGHKFHQGQQQHISFSTVQMSTLATFEVKFIYTLDSMQFLIWDITFVSSNIHDHVICIYVPIKGEVPEIPSKTGQRVCLSRHQFRYVHFGMVTFHDMSG